MPDTYTLPFRFKKDSYGYVIGEDGRVHAQEPKLITAEGVYDTSMNNEVTVEIPMTPRLITAEGTYDVTYNNELTVDIPYEPVVIRANGTYDVTGNDQATVFISGQGDPTLKEKTVTENGEYVADDELADGYSKVTVDVANTYTPSDEGKVVSNGALVSQSSLEITENGEYDTTLVNEIAVNVLSIPENDLLFHFEDFKNSGKMDAAFYNTTGYEISDEQSKFGGTSLKIKSSPASGGAVYLPAGFTLGAENFTLDLWMYVTATSSGKCVVSFNYRSLGGYVNSGTSIGWDLASSSGSWAIVRPVNVQTILNAWHHWALVRQGNTFYSFLDGALIDTFDWSGSFAPMTRISFGTNSTDSSNFRGYIDEFRLKLGEAVWTEDFTPPTQPYE